VPCDKSSKAPPADAKASVASAIQMPYLQKLVRCFLYERSACGSIRIDILHDRPSRRYADLRGFSPSIAPFRFVPTPTLVSLPLLAVTLGRLPAKDIRTPKARITCPPHSSVQLSPHKTAIHASNSYGSFPSPWRPSDRNERLVPAGSPLASFSPRRPTHKKSVPYSEPGTPPVHR